LFEATLVALGVLRGELRLDDPVNKYVTELHGDYVGRVTIGELVTHTSGLLLPTDHPPWPNASYSLAEFIDMLNAWTPRMGMEQADPPRGPGIRLGLGALGLPAGRGPVAHPDRAGDHQYSDAPRHAFDDARTRAR
jgi:hypothetical protein